MVEVRERARFIADEVLYPAAPRRCGRPPRWSPPVAGRRCATGHDAQRLAREALFTLVAATRPEIKVALLGLLDHGTAPAR